MDLQERYRQKVNEHSRRVQGNFAGMLAMLVPVLMIAGFVAMIVMTLATGFRGVIILAKTFPLYPAVFLCAVAALYLVVRLVRIPFVNILAALAAAAAVGFFGFKAATSYYAASPMVFPSVYSADFVQAAADGKTPSLFERRAGKGSVLASLAADEKVAVNGISFDLKEFKVTTAAGKTGWVDSSAFPEDAAQMLALNVGLDGIDTRELAVDRQVTRLIEKYMDKKEVTGSTGQVMVSYAVSPNTLNRSLRVNAETPLLYVDRKAFKKGASLADSGVKVKLANILYAPDCTVVYLTASHVYDKNGKNPLSWYLPGPQNTNGWKTSLTVKDLATGESWSLLPADYAVTYKEDIDEKNRAIRTSSVVYFFPPFKSRNFSLVHGESPLPDAANSGFGGIMGLAASLTGVSRAYDYYLDYNFERVQVK